MRVGVVLAGAAAAAVLLTVLTAAAAVQITTDPVIQGCAAAMNVADAANTAHQDALEVLDYEHYRRRVINEPVEQRARAEVDRTARVLDVARADVARLCHIPDTPGRSTAEGGADGHLG